VDNYSHLTTPELNQIIHDLSRESARAYHAGFLDELARESEALGLYQRERLNRRLEGKSPRPDCDIELGIDTKPSRSL